MHAAGGAEFVGGRRRGQNEGQDEEGCACEHVFLRESGMRYRHYHGDAPISSISHLTRRVFVLRNAGEQGS
jgi:hypothetical protein